jgi:hypothetical protein
LGASATLESNRIGYVTLYGPVAPTVVSNWFGDAHPWRLTDVNASFGGFAGNEYAYGTNTWMELSGTLTNNLTLGLIDGVVGNYYLNGNLVVSSNVTLTLASGVTLQSPQYSYGVYVDGVLTGTNATLELLGTYCYYSCYYSTLYVRDGGRVDLAGGTIAGPGHVEVQTNGEMNVTDETFANQGGIIAMNYYAGSTGVVCQVCGPFAFGLTGNNGVVVHWNDFSQASVVSAGDPATAYDLSFNYWGSTDPGVIDARIYDRLDDANRPLIIFDPCLAASPANVVRFFVLGQSPQTNLVNSRDHIDVAFSRPLQTNTWAVSNISFTGPHGAIPITSAAMLESNVGRLSFAPVAEPGSYQLTVAPRIRDTQGQLLDQDGDGTPGETTQDRYIAMFTLPPPRVYYTDFEGGIGPEWSQQTLTCAPVFSRFTGRFGNDTQTLTVSNLTIGEPYVLSFDLYVIDSWDGDGPVAGPDYFNVAIDGIQVFHETFANYNGTPPQQTQSFPREPDSGRVNLGFNGYVDAIYRGIQIAFVASNATTAFAFSGAGLESVDNESWGLDNVAIITTGTGDNPDLTIGSLTAPSAAQMGQAIQVIYAITNAGSVVAQGPWYNAVLLATNAAGDGAQTLGHIVFSQSLSPGGTITLTQSVILPGGISGERFLGVRVDSAGQVFEADEMNNLAMVATPLHIQAADLIVGSLGAPSGVLLGETFNATWAVTNAGTASAYASWTDRLYLSTNNNTFAGAVQLAAGAFNNAPLVAGDGYVRTQAVTLALNSGVVPGDYYLIAVTDYGAVQSEACETNNQLSRPITINLPPLPDLIVTNAGTPAQILPGDAATLVWTVTNCGIATASNVWRESVAVSNATQGLRLLADFAFTNQIDPGEFLMRTQTITMPADLPAGAQQFFVTVDSRFDVFELNETNNTAAATNVSTVPVLLTLQLPASQLAEGGSMTATVSRNGDRAQPLTVWLTNSAPKKLNYTNQIIIPAGQAAASFAIQAVTNGVVDDDQTVSIAAAADGYQPAAGEFTVLNVDMPHLSLQLFNNTVMEGATLGIMVTRDYDTNQPLTVQIASSSPGKLSVPASVTIPAGQWSLTFALLAVNNTQVEGPLDYTVTASATNYTSANATVTVLDDDVSSVTLTVSPATVSEGAGPQAAVGTVTRNVVTGRALVVDLVSSNPNKLLVPPWVAILGNQASASFPMTTVDNQIVDGDTTVTIQPYVTATTTGARLAPGVPAQVVVTDDDGPTLRLSIAHKLVAEGLSPATTATVTRNTSTNGALVVSLQSSDLSEATVPPTVTIPAGQTSATFNLNTVQDNQPDGNQTVTISASAAGFTGSADTMVVSDIDLPDLVVSRISLPDSADTESYFNVTYRVSNQGLGPAGTNWVTRVFLSDDPVVGNDTFVGGYTFNGTMNVGQFFEQTLSVHAPQNVGQYWIIVSTDVGGSIAETLEDNNTSVSATPVQVQAAYHATVQTDVTNALAGTPIPLSGAARRVSNNQPAPFVPVTIHLKLRDSTRLIAALTDADGNYAITFIPLANEAGHYTLGADHPGVPETAVQDEFNLRGFRCEPSLLPTIIAEGSTVTGAVALINLGELPLSGLAPTIVTQMPNLSVAINVSDGGALPGSTNISLGYSFTANNASVSEGFVQVRVTSTVGATADILLPVRVDLLRAKLAALPENLLAGMARGRQVSLPFDVFNQGAVDSGPVTVSLPALSWLQVAGDNPLPSIPPGQTNRVTLLLTPPADLALGVHSGSLVLQCATASLMVPFEFRALSEARGDLLVTAVDEYTYYAEGSPKVANAAVRVTDSLTGLVLTNGVTDSNGVFAATNVLESYYEIEVTADSHSSYHATMFLQQGQTNVVSAFLARQAVKYTWTVVPTEIEDRTSIILETTFETFVPMPVITVEPASVDLADITEEVSQINFTISNQGLVAAQAARLVFQAHPRWQFTPLTEYIGELPARSSVTIPVTVTKLHPEQGMSARTAKPADENAPTVDPCNLFASVLYQLICGTLQNTYQSPIALYNAADCGPKIPPTPPPPPPSDPDQPIEVYVPPVQPLLPPISLPPSLPPPPSSYVYTSGGGWNGSFSWGGWGGGGGGDVYQSNYVPPPAAASGSQNLCDPCNFELTLAVSECIIGVLPIPILELPKCIFGAFECVTDPGFLSCGGALLDCAAAAGKEVPVVGQIVGLIGCADSILSSCNGPGLIGFLKDINPLAVSQPGVQKSYSDGHIARAQTSSAGYSAQMDDFQKHGQRLLTHLNMLRVMIGDDAWFHRNQGTNFGVWLEAFGNCAHAGTDAGERISETERAQLLTVPFPDGLTTNHLNKFIDRWNRTWDYHDAGITNLNDVPGGWSTDFITRDAFTNAVYEMYAAVAANEAEGITNAAAGLQLAYNNLNAALNQGTGGGGVCGKVSLRLDQQAVISRDAFNATLEIENGADTALSGMAANILVMNETGQDVTGLFGVRPPTLVNVTNVTGAGGLPAHNTASISWIIIPTSDAAPDAPLVYYVSGTLRYTQDGTQVSVPLAAVPITVYPTPRLFVKYFHERDVYSDDPFTDVIEPTIPFNLAVMVENRGKGIAKNMRITSSQPQIVDNEKGLLVDFKIIGTEVAGQNLSPSLTVNFGNINAGQIAIGRWLLTSTVQGLFTDYKATFEHIDGLGNPKLSLIEDVSIHEMIHLVRAGGAFEDGKPDFLVNDITDPRDLPDTLYLSDGTTNPVALAELASVDSPPTSGHLQAQLTASMPAGWTYLRVPEPSAGQLRLVRVVRSDGVEIPFGTNVWTTDRTFIGMGKRPINENILHLLDYNSTGIYTLTYVAPPMPDTNAPSSAVAALPADSPILFRVQWSGTDDDSGIANYDIFVSANDGSFVPWLQKTPLTSASYQGVPGGHYAFYSVATDAAGNQENPPVTPDAMTTVTITNHAPVLTSLPVQTIDEGTLLQLTVPASDSDPNDTLAFSLAAGAPSGMTINRSTGLITWQTGEINGPSTNTFTVNVADDGLPPLSAATNVTVIVREVNTAPVLTPILNRTINEGAILWVTNRATDSDIPANRLTFTLGPGAPAGATITTNGLFHWQPTELQGPSTNLIQVIVSDDGTPSLSATQSFTVMVRDVLSDFKLAVGSTNVMAGENGIVPILLTSSGLDLTNISFFLETPSEQLTNFSLQPVSAEILSSLLQPAGADRSQVQFILDAGQMQPGLRQLAALGFLAATRTNSTVAPLRISQLRGIRSGNLVIVNGMAVPGRVIIIANESVLEATQPTTLLLYGKEGVHYAIEARTNLDAGTSWAEIHRLQLTNGMGTFTNFNIDGAIYFRSLELP